MKQRSVSRLIRLSLAGLFAGCFSTAFAGGFQLFEANGEGTGDFFAGGAAIADDASTAYFNPAGLVRIPNQQLVLSADSIITNIDFQGSNTWSPTPVAQQTLQAQFPGLSMPSSYTEMGQAQAGSYNLVPSFDYAAPLGSDAGFGFSVNVPFGLDTNYSENSFVRYAATQTSINVIDLSPSIGFKLTDQFSLGAGADADYANANFDLMAGLPTFAIATGMNPTAFDTESDNQANGWGYGWHAGALYQFTQDTRVGLAYHSKVTFDLNGTSRFTGNLAGGPTTLFTPSASQYTSDAASVSTTLPATTMLSAYEQINPEWAVMGTAAYTQWDVFNNLSLQNVAAVNAMLGPDQITVFVPQGFRNTWRFALGGSFAPCPIWAIRAGIGYDESPTVSEFRNVRLPDGNRIAAALGAHYQATKTVGVDVGWTHEFVQDGSVNVNQVVGNQQTFTLGKAQNTVDILGVQLTWDIV